MTREKLRAEAIKVLECTLLGNFLMAEACINALGEAGFILLGPDLTMEMCDAGEEDLESMYFNMAAAGDLTRPIK